jgi:glycosyltransferase involved in cell wall biosynthesis
MDASAVSEPFVSPVSVVIPCYRCVETVGRAVLSVLAQTLQPVELILVEDRSDDQGATLDALHALKAQHQAQLPITVLEMPRNGGPGEARNFGWSFARQPYIAFLDADDSWHPRKLEIQYTWMQRHPEVSMSCHATLVLEGMREDVDLTAHFKAERIKARKLLFVNYIPTRSVMLKREVENRFPLGKRYAEDYELWLSLLFAGYQAWRLEAPLAFSYKQEFGEGGLTGCMHNMHQGEIGAYQSLLKAGQIGYLTCLAACSFAHLKYWRRQLMVGFRRQRRC